MVSPEESRYLRGLATGRLLGQRCPACRKVYLPPRGACPTDGAPPDPQGLRDGLDWVLTHLVVLRAPMVLVLDDAHWADPESLGWLAAFAPRAEELPLLVVAAYRPGRALNPSARAGRSAGR